MAPLENLVSVLPSVEPEQNVHAAAVPQEVDKKVEVKVAPIIRKPTLTYIADDRPLFPEITRNSNDKKYIAKQVMPEVAVSEDPVHAHHKGRSVATLVLKSAVLVFVAVIALSSVFYISLGIDSTVSVEKGKPASVALTQEKTFCFISGNCQTDSIAPQQ
jgi:hypothetical protein